MAERSAGWYDDEADATCLRYWDGRSWTPHTAPRSDSPEPSSTPSTTESAPPLAHDATSAPLLATDEDLARLVTQTLRLVPEHTTVPMPHGQPAASAPLLSTRAMGSAGGLSRAHVTLLTVVALVAGSLVITLTSSAALLLLA